MVWEKGLRLVAVSPAKKTEELLDHGGSVLSQGIVDATCINLGEDRLPLDQRMGNKDGIPALWSGGADVWDERPVNLSAGDCIATGYGRRDARKTYRSMLFNAIGVCNIVTREMTGHYRPPIRMPRELRAALVTSVEVKVDSLPTFEIARPLSWSGQEVSLNLSTAVGNEDADDLMNGPIGNCGLSSYLGYETGNGTLNHHLSGKDEIGYQRNVSDRIAACLYTAFDPKVDPAKRQRSLNKFIQVGLDYYYMHSLGYPVWNGGGGHPNGTEGVITLTGALLVDAAITDAMKFQRFRGDAVGQPGKVYDMLATPPGSFARSEALYTVSSADWLSGKFIRRAVGNGAASLDECYVRIDMAREDLVLNNRDVPYTEIAPSENSSAITIGSDYTWPMFSRNLATSASRSYRYIPGAVMRLNGDTTIRKILDFKAGDGAAWTEASWNSAKGKGGILIVYPALSANESKSIKQSGLLTTGVCTKEEARSGEVILWDSWPATSENDVLTSFFSSPIQDYLDIKLGDHLQWLPFYHLLNDPGAPGQKLHQESATYRQVKAFVVMQRNFGTYFWGKFAGSPNFPNTPPIQALIRHYLLDDRMPAGYCKTYNTSDKMWVDPAK